MTARVLWRTLILWHLCSLDAPTVAVVWTWFIAHACGIGLPLTSLAAMGIAVWLFYAGDRLLDCRLGLDARSSLVAQSSELEARHRFHYHHRHRFLWGIVLGAIVLALLLHDNSAVAMRLYMIEGAALAAWFFAIHRFRGRVRLPKELAVGPFFAAAVFIPTIARAPQFRASLVFPAILLGAVCCLNCLFIYAWEHKASGLERAHLSTRIAVRSLPQIAVAVVVICCCAAEFCVRPTISQGCALAVAGLLVLHGRRKKIARVRLRALADLVLLIPLLVGWR